MATNQTRHIAYILQLSYFVCTVVQKIELLPPSSRMSCLILALYDCLYGGLFSTCRWGFWEVLQTGYDSAITITTWLYI